MGELTKGNGSPTRCTERVLNVGRAAQCTVVSSSTISERGMARSLGQISASMKGIGRTVDSTDSGTLQALVASNSVVSGSTARFKIGWMRMVSALRSQI